MKIANFRQKLFGKKSRRRKERRKEWRTKNHLQVKRKLSRLSKLETIK